MIPMRLSVKSTPAAGQCPVWYISPAKASRPGMSGMFAVDNAPVAMTQNRAVTSSPLSVRTVHDICRSSSTAEMTRVWQRMSRRRSNRSAT